MKRREEGQETGIEKQKRKKEASDKVKTESRMTKNRKNKEEQREKGRRGGREGSKDKK